MFKMKTHHPFTTNLSPHINLPQLIKPPPEREHLAGLALQEHMGRGCFRCYQKCAMTVNKHCREPLDRSIQTANQAATMAQCLIITARY